MSPPLEGMASAPHPAGMMAGMNTTQALGGDDVIERVLIDGRPHWRFSCGTLLPVISGGATDDGGGDGSAGEGDDSDAGGDTKKVEYTPEQQAHMAEVIKTEKAKAAAAATKAAERAKMDEADRLKAEKADAEKQAADALAKANERIVTAEAKVQAIDAGADPKQLAYVLKLADLTDVKVDDDGTPDEKAIRKAIDKVLADVPALKTSSTSTGRSGADGINGNGGQAKPSNLEEAVAAKLAAAS